MNSLSCLRERIGEGHAAATSAMLVDAFPDGKAAPPADPPAAQRRIALVHLPLVHLPNQHRLLP